MGVFNRNKIDKNTAVHLKKVDGWQISGRALVKTHGAKPLMDSLPEGVGRFYLKNNGTCFVMMDWDFNGLPLFDEIHFSDIRSWGRYSDFPIFETIDLENSIIEEPEDKILCFEEIYSSIMFVQVDDYSVENSFYVRNWLERYHPGLEKFSP